MTNEATENKTIAYLLMETGMIYYDNKNQQWYM
jgi:hypothetical protein